MRANETYSEAKRQFSYRNRAVLMNVLSPHKWWSTLKSAVFDTSSSLPPFVSEGGGRVALTMLVDRRAIMPSVTKMRIANCAHIGTAVCTKGAKRLNLTNLT